MRIIKVDDYTQVREIDDQEYWVEILNIVTNCPTEQFGPYDSEQKALKIARQKVMEEEETDRG